jgi:sugar lactone lactonase YvrE
MKQIIAILSAGLIISSCALQPESWTPDKKPAMEGRYAPNNLLESTEWIDLKGWYGPEDIAVDAAGNLYAGVHLSEKDFTNGQVIKISPDGSISTYCNTESWVAGLHFDADGNLIACDSQRGLIKIDTTGQLEVLVTESEDGTPIKLPNDVDIDEEGNIYFSSTSSRYHFSMQNARRILLEAKPDGGLYKYDPKNGKVTTLIDSAYFGNGVALAKNAEFVLMVDLTKYRVVRHWLKGDKAGTTDIFLDNLPGLPNGISRREDGSFWLGYTTRRSDALDKIQPKPKLKQFVYALPIWMQPKQEKYGMIMHISAEGEVLQTYHDPTGEHVSEAASIEEHDGYLYLGGDLIDHIGKYKLPH